MLTRTSILKVARMLDQTGGREGYRIPPPIPGDTTTRPNERSLHYIEEPITGDLKLVIGPGPPIGRPYQPTVK